MTDRRSYLATVALAATGLAGCAEDTSEDSGDGKIGGPADEDARHHAVGSEAPLVR